MSVRSEKRHPKTPPEKLLTTREEILAFADFLSAHEPWLRKVMVSTDFLRAEDARTNVWWRRVWARVHGK